jgi:outer membrane protein TolC
MEQCEMRHERSNGLIRLARLSSAALAILCTAVSASGQTGQLQFEQAQTPASSSAQAAAPVRRLTMDEAVKLALEQNLGIQSERITPQLQDVSIALARTGWVPTFNTTITNNSQNNPSTSALSGGATSINDSRFATEIGLSQFLRTGANYSLSWTSSRATSTNIFNNFDPLIRSGLAFNVSQPLLRNFKIDNVRQQIAVAQRDREGADYQLQATIVSTTRNVRNAYWDLAYQIANLGAAQQSLDLARRLLGDNQKRVQIGTMAPIDIVEAESEVARNEESVIVAEAAIEQAEDRLRALILDPAAPDFWTVALEPTETPEFQAVSIDTEGAVRRAMENRTDIRIARNNLARTDVNIRYFRNQSLPEVNAEAAYATSAVGGVQLSPLTSIPLGPVNRSILAERAYGSVLGDVFTGDFPQWTVGVAIAYPIGTSNSEANLARARLQQRQEETQLRNLELQVATQVRDIARQVQTNQKRVDAARVARELAERRLEAEEKKFTAGIQTSFFVFQAQRDLAQARSNFLRTAADYAKSTVDFEAVQQAPFQGSAIVVSQSNTAVSNPNAPR